jgi:hypothetical protein
VVVAFGAFFTFTWRRRRDLFFYGAAFVFSLAPYAHVVSVVRWRADRYVYLASAFLFAIAATTAAELIRARPALLRVFVGAGIAWALSTTFIDVTNAPRFRDDRALWTYEVGLREPAVHAFSALASSLAGEARAAEPARRLALADEAERVARAGIAYYESIAWRKGAPVRIYADLYAQLGLVSALRGEPPSAQLALFEQSYRIHQTETNLLFLARTLSRIASANHDLAMARRSLTIYGALVHHRAKDAAQRPITHRVLDDYRHAFPQLTPEIDALEAAP